MNTLIPMMYLRRKLFLSYIENKTSVRYEIIITTLTYHNFLKFELPLHTNTLHVILTLRKTNLDYLVLKPDFKHKLKI